MRRMGTGLAIRGGAVALMAMITATAATSAPTGGRQMERLDRALVVNVPMPFMSDPPAPAAFGF